MTCDTVILLSHITCLIGHILKVISINKIRFTQSHSIKALLIIFHVAKKYNIIMIIVT